MTPADMRNEALRRLEESDQRFYRLEDPTTPEWEYHRVAHLRQTALVFAVLSGDDQ